MPPPVRPARAEQIDVHPLHTRHWRSSLILRIPVAAFVVWSYPQYREDGVANPEVGNTLISIPMLPTANPVGSIAARISMHVTAVTHSYEATVFLPPQTGS